jgi:short-subunit dehydrogenase
MPSNLREARTLVTGATSGLGRALALALTRRGARVIATGRSADRLEDLRREAGAIETFAADLTDEGDRRRLIDAVASRFDGALDVAVQAAGVGAYGRFTSHDPSVLREIFEVNFFAPAELARGLYPLLRLGTRPAMVVIGSIVARRGLPGRPEYSASKFALAGLVESLRSEWTRDGIHILLVNPGFTRTGFERNLLVDTAYIKSEHRRSMAPEAVADAALRALARRKNEITLSLNGRTLLLVNRILPRLVDWGLGRWTRKLYTKHDPEGRDGLKTPEHPASV